MKIDKSRLNSLYDQYSNQENRLTHALLHTTGSSKWLFSRFLKNVIGVETLSPRSIYEISTQKVPFSHGDNDPENVESIPDAWIVNEDSDLGIAIEVKDRKNSISLPQLESHAKRVESYDSPYLLVITPDLKIPDKVIQFEKKKILHSCLKL